MEIAVKSKQYQAPADWLKSAVETLCASGIEVLAPTKDECGDINFAPIASADHIATDYINVLVPLKEVLFPRTEVLMNYRKQEKGDVTLHPEASPSEERVVMGCRPCDASALEVLDEVFAWDYKDAPYWDKREKTTVVTWACAKAGPRCFCTSVGGSPHDTRGSDVLVFMNDDGGSLLNVITEKGEQFIERISNGVQLDTAETEMPMAPELEQKFDTDRIKLWLDNNFESDFWADVALPCLGCGLCSFLCPTCHCFDIVDESTWNCGQRRRNWDCCAFSNFTLHASGHNPRPDQTSRCRQRVMHKFKYFPERFGKIACVGCGRCVTNCGVGQNLVSILTEIESRS